MLHQEYLSSQTTQCHQPQCCIKNTRLRRQHNIISLNAASRILDFGDNTISSALMLLQEYSTSETTQYNQPQCCIKNTRLRRKHNIISLNAASRILEFADNTISSASMLHQEYSTSQTTQCHQPQGCIKITWLRTQHKIVNLVKSGDQRLKDDFRTTTNGRVGELLARTGSLSGHPSKQQPRLTLLDLVILRYTPTCDTQCGVPATDCPRLVGGFTPVEAAVRVAPAVDDTQEQEAPGGQDNPVSRLQVEWSSILEPPDGRLRRTLCVTVQGHRVVSGDNQIRRMFCDSRRSRLAWNKNK
ncbi:hypothetical protein J6590_026263 [Homalodisca vitripennis]|nr:hypothetical protein J6590_026263 [Homalodisca vitripennis]